ncbi:MAG: TonB-dependent receptor [Alphaproteobacteria bacterium]|nr:TonB-dependent receptor [Alphaproteobacteria bacterium]MBM3623774.1 TonB-dependent receptor [Alphaproteobacteria bacterium]
MQQKHLALGVSVLTLALADPHYSAAQQALPIIEIGKPKQLGGRAARPSGPRSSGGASTVAQPGSAADGGQGTGEPALFTPGGGSLVAPSIPTLRAQLNRTVGSVAFVDSNTPAQQTRYMADLRDALKDTPGVFAESRYGAELRLSVRGSNLTRDYHNRGLELLQDGIPMTFADGAGDTYSVDPRYYRAIEVYKGGNGLTYGSSTLGGAINFVSPTAYTAISPNYLNLEGGSFETIRGQVQGSRIVGNFDVLLNGSFTHSLGFRGHEKSDYTLINGNAGYRFSNNLETRMYFGYYNTHQQIPGTLTLGQIAADPRLSLPPFVEGYGTFYGNYINPASGDWGFSGNQGRYQQNFRIANKTSYVTEFGQLDVNSWFIGQYLYHPVFVIIQQNTNNWGFTPRFTSTHDLFGYKNEVIAGARVWGQSGSDKWWTNFNGAIANPYGLSDRPTLFNSLGVPPFGNVIGAGFPNWSWNSLSQFGFNNGNNACGFFSYAILQDCPLVPFIPVGQNPALRNNRNNAFNVEFYAEDRFHLTENLVAMAGLKYISDRRAATALGGIPFEPMSGSSSKTYHGLMPKFGLMFQATPDVQVFSDVTLSRDVPDMIDLTQTLFPPQPPWLPNSEGQFGFRLNNLKAQKAWTGEIGSRGKFDRFAWDITYYYANVWDELLKFNTNPASGVVSVTRNAPNTVHQGVELGGSVEVLRDLLGEGAGDVLKIAQIWNMNLYAFAGDPTYGNNWLPAIPRHVLRTTVSYATADGLYVAPQVDWVPSGAYVDYANTLRAPGYALIGLQAGLKMANGLEWYVDARNLGNVHYVSDVVSVANAVRPPFTIATGLYDWVPGNPQAFYPGNGASVYAGVKYRF